jgi:UPF0755 protein
MKKTYKRSMATVCGLLFLIFIGLSVGLAFYLLNPGDSGALDQIFFIRPGLSFKEVAHELEANSLIKHKGLFLFWARIRKADAKIKAGEYLLNPDMPPLRILSILSKGMVITHAVTIPEGYTAQQIAELLETNKLLDKTKFMALAFDPELVQKYGFTSPSLEGYLYPDTYYFSKGLSTQIIIDTMVNHFLAEIKPYKARIEQSGMSLAEIVTLASIVEKETALAEERPLIAGVFLNRLKKNMRLESDPTVIYGIKNFNGNLTRNDLHQNTPYNTYVIFGLPPGPIANPGIDAIKAVLEPAASNYIFFVSMNNGSHYFSETLAEHNRAVNKFQKRREN